VRSYRPHLEEKDPIWDDDRSHSRTIRRSPSWGFLGFSSAVRQIPGTLCTAPRIISLSPLSLATAMTHATLGASGIWLGTRTWTADTATLTEVFWSQPMVSLTTGYFIYDVLCDPTDLIWRKGTPFEAMPGRTAPSSDGLLAEVSRGFPQS
jgi:hypothetical protein